MADGARFMGEMVPIIAIVMGIGIAMLGMWLDYRKKSEIFALHHKERMAAIEKGMEVPPLPPELFQRRSRAPSECLRRGLVWLAIGAALTTAMMIEEHRGAAYGLIPAAIGIANLVYYFLQPRVPAEPKA
jgi:hypothetical protein